jgi:hypothetical protein
VTFVRGGGIEWCLYERFDPQTRLNDLFEERTQSTALDDNRNTLPLEATVDRMLATDYQAATRPQ